MLAAFAPTQLRLPIPLPRAKVARHIQTGSRGEDKAADYLRQLGYLVLDRNVQLGHDEIDIVAWDPRDRVVVFTEVKTRTWAHSAYHPEINLTYEKRRCLIRAARRWMYRAGRSDGYRLDLLCVANNKVIAHYKELALHVSNR